MSTEPDSPAGQAKITDADRECALNSSPWPNKPLEDKIAQLIATSEAEAMKELRAEVERLRWAHDQSGGDIGVLERKLAEAEAKSTHLENNCNAINAKLTAAEAQVQELTKDKARLDWLRDHIVEVRKPLRLGGAKLIFTAGEWNPDGERTLRDHIDYEISLARRAAMNPASHDTH
jgi:hypothetical protein